MPKKRRIDSILERAIVELYRKCACRLPEDVFLALERCRRSEREKLPRETLQLILENAALAKDEARPICQDTGSPIFFVSAPEGFSELRIRKTIERATVRATREIPLRSNSVDIVSGVNSGNNIGAGFPPIFYREHSRGALEVWLLLKGGGSENVGATYQLPDKRLNAERDLEGVRRAVLDSVVQAQGRGCPPYIIGVGIAGTKETAALEAKRQLLRKIPERNPNAKLDALEKRLKREINSLGIGPAGLGGKATAIAVKIGPLHRHPASFFVDISFCCWACRRWKLTFARGKIRYE